MDEVQRAAGQAQAPVWPQSAATLLGPRPSQVTGERKGSPSHRPKQRFRRSFKEQSQPAVHRGPAGQNAHERLTNRERSLVQKKKQGASPNSSEPSPQLMAAVKQPGVALSTPAPPAINSPASSATTSGGTWEQRRDRRGQRVGLHPCRGFAAASDLESQECQMKLVPIPKWGAACGFVSCPVDRTFKFKFSSCSTLVVDAIGQVGAVRGHAPGPWPPPAPGAAVGRTSGGGPGGGSPTSRRRSPPRCRRAAPRGAASPPGSRPPRVQAHRFPFGGDSRGGGSHAMFLTWDVRGVGRTFSTAMVDPCP